MMEITCLTPVINLKYIGPNDMSAVLETIQKVKREVIDSGKIIHHTDNFIRLAMAPVEKFEVLMKWINDNDFRKGLLGAPLNADESKRISEYKFTLKARQITPPNTGLLYILVDPLYFCFGDFLKGVASFENRLRAYPQLFGAVMYSTIIDGGNPSSALENGHFYGMKRLHNVVTRHLLFVKNPGYNGTLKKQTIEDIYKTFE